MVGDAQRLRQILFNLVGNAVKFTHHGTINLESWQLPAHDNGAETVRILFRVRDTGIGMSEESLKHVFEPFAQAETRFKRQFQGAGLGLSITKKLLDLMGGVLSVNSEEGVGTEFYFALPFKATRGQEDTAPAPLRATRDTVLSARALVVEDDVVNRISLTKLLEKLGLRVVSAEDGEQALDILREQEIDVVFMDIQLPLLDGVEVTRCIRSREEFRNKAEIPIVALTAYAMTGDREKFLEAGMNEYLAKPVELTELNEVLGKVLRTAR